MSVIHLRVTMANALIWWLTLPASVIMAMEEKFVMLVCIVDQFDPVF